MENGKKKRREGERKVKGREGEQRESEGVVKSRGACAKHSFTVSGYELCFRYISSLICRVLNPDLEGALGVPPTPRRYILKGEGSGERRNLY